VRAFLFDVNVLVALLWPAHQFHARAHHWFERNMGEGWATCPLTQAGFVRIVSNPAFSADAVAPHVALSVLQASLRHASHQFWPDDISLPEAVLPLLEKLTGHRQVTDAYLLGLAIRNRARLATFDRSLSSLLPSNSPNQDRIEVL
jgi:toxin-antitoxin system PIN domain toxin